MSSAIERPVFFENQILGAVDLTATVDLARGQQARHNRYLHLWGIAYELKLKQETDKDKGDPFIKITLTAGLAIDGTGREIIVSEAVALSENTFSQLQIAQGADLENDWFPVFLVGRDQKTKQPPLNTGGCNGSSPTRVSEGFEITFGRPGEARKLDEQDAGTVSDGPGNGGWKILLGFVQWDKTQNAFTGLKTEDGGVGRKYAGVQADEVAARGGSLQLRTQTKPQEKKPALVLDETDDGQLQFGSLDPRGNLKAVFTVNAKGDITAAGKISGAVAPGSVQIQSGVVFDGLLLPLPPGIASDDIDSGKLTLHSHVTPRITADQAPATPPGANWGVVPIDCFVDAARKVTCRLRWYTIDAAPTIIDQAGFCDYLAMVSVPATTGNNP